MSTQKTSIYTAVAVALGVAFASGNVVAGTNNTVPRAFVAQSVAANNNVITLPGGTITYTVTGVALAATNTVTLVLPTGMSVSPGQVIATLENLTAVPNAAPAINGTSITFTLANPIAVGQTFTITSPMMVSGAASMATPDANPGVGLATGMWDSANGLPAISTKNNVLLSVNAINFNAFGINSFIAVASPSNATKFNVPGSQTATSLAADTGSVAMSAAGALNAATGLPYTFPSGAGTTMTVSGNFASVASAFLKQPQTGACPEAAPSGAITGAVTGGTTLSFANFKTDGSLYDVCIVTDGKAIIRPNDTVAIAATAGVGTLGTVNRNLGNIFYNGNVDQYSYVTNGGGGYTYYINLNATSLTDVPVQAVFTLTDGTVKSGAAGTVKGGQSQLMSIDSLAKAAGLPAAFGQAQVAIMSGAPFNTQGLLVNPDSSIDNF